MAKKKEHPTAVPCICGRQPVAAKSKKGWVIACPAVRSCTNNTAAKHKNLDDAVEAWNTAIASLLYKEAQK